MSRALLGERADRKRSYRDVELQAGAFRAKLGLGPLDPIRPRNLFEDLHTFHAVSRGRRIPLNYGVENMESAEGYARYDESRNKIEIIASEQAYEWIKDEHPRGSYFLCHELGHSLLHTDQLIRLAGLPTQQAAFHRAKRNHEVCEDTEWQANAFASALLMPAHGVAKIVARFGSESLIHVASKFHVSYEAAGYRLQLFKQRSEQLLY